MEPHSPLELRVSLYTVEPLNTNPQSPSLLYEPLRLYQKTISNQKSEIVLPQLCVQTMVAHCSLIESVNKREISFSRGQVIQVTPIVLQRGGIRSQLEREREREAHQGTRQHKNIFPGSAN